MVDLRQLIGKTIESISEPEKLSFRRDGHEDDVYADYCMAIKFTDGTVWKLASWDYEGYSSGVHQEIIVE